MAILEKIVRHLKAEPDYAIRSNYSFRQIAYTVLSRFHQALRGMFLRMRFGSAKGIAFCGRSVVVEHAHQIRSGTGLILEDGVYVNALSERGIVLGRNVTIGRKSVVVCTGVFANRGVGITIGDHSAVGAQSFLGGQGGLNIGNNVIMGPGVKIFSENHRYADPFVLIRLQGESRKGVTIEDNCWIGAAVTILDGVTVGAGSVVGAGAVVTSSIPMNSFAAGVPAKVIRDRTQTS